MSPKILDAVLTGAPPTLKGYSIYTNAFQLMIKQRNALIKDGWTSLTTLANRGIGEAYGAFCEINRSAGVLERQAEEAKKAQAEFFKYHASKKETRAEFFSQLKDELKKKEPDVSNEWLDALDALGQGKIKDNFILEFLKKPQPKNTEMTESAINATVALAVRSMMALTHAAFMRHYKKVKKYPFIGHKEDLAEILRLKVDQFEETLENSMKQLHDAVKSNSSIDYSCQEIRRIVEQLLPPFGRLQATTHLFAESLKAGKEEARSEKVGRLAARAGDLTRLAYAAYSASYYLEMNSKFSGTDSRIKKILEPAATLKYDTKFPTGKRTQISNVDACTVGDFIEVAGFVESVQIRKEGNDKLLSIVKLIDQSSGAQTEAVGVFAHFSHLGLQKGSYCILSGNWSKQSSINKNKPAVEVDKVNIGDLSKKAWKILFLDLADKTFDRWPGGCNMQFSLGPHTSKFVDGKESNSLGVGELIFKPFIRN